MFEAVEERATTRAMLRRRRWALVVRNLLWFVASVCAALLLVAVLVVVQGTYNEMRRTDAILVLPGDCSVAPDCATPQLEYALDLYQRDYAPHLILVGAEAVASERAYLLGKGFPEQSLVVEDQEEARYAQLRRVAELARERRISSLLVVGTPPEILLTLKIAHDLDLAAYSAPLPGTSAFAPIDVARESLAYWRYVLFAQ